MVLGIAAFAEEPVPALFISVWLAGWWFGSAFLVMRVWTTWRAALANPGITVLFGAIAASAFALPFVGFLLVGLGFFTAMTSLGGAMLLALAAVINMLFFHLLKAPTMLGREAPG